jgi:uncharacterized protein YbjT (DUF2867 family)
MKIAVIGGTGLIGSQVVRILNARWTLALASVATVPVLTPPPGWVL